MKKFFQALGIFALTLGMPFMMVVAAIERPVAIEHLTFDRHQVKHYFDKRTREISGHLSLDRYQVEYRVYERKRIIGISSTLWLEERGGQVVRVTQLFKAGGNLQTIEPARQEERILWKKYFSS